MAVVDGLIKSNADFHYKAGLSPKIIRKSNGHCCDWCSGLVGVYDYEEVKDNGNAVFRRHRHCDCTVIYDPNDGGKKRNVHTRKEIDYDKKVRIETSSLDIDKEIIDNIKKLDLTKASKDDLVNLGRQVNENNRISGLIGNKKELVKILQKYRDIGGNLDKELILEDSDLDIYNIFKNAYKYYPKEWVNVLKERKIKFNFLKVDRGFFFPGYVDIEGYYYPKLSDVITVAAKGDRKTTPFHEIGHVIEWQNPEVLRIEKEFINSRTKNEKETRMVDIFPGFGYNENEVTKKDDFISPYIGKSYDNATEVLSIGLESLFEPGEGKLKEFKNQRPVLKNITDDQEYLNLIIGLYIKG